MNKSKNYLYLALFTTLLCLCCFLPNIISHIPLTYGTDLKPQQYFFVKEIYRLYDQFFLQGILPFYSWNAFLGTNFFGGFSFYGNADVFNLLGYLFKNINFFDLEMGLTALKMFVASFTMYAFLSQFNFNHKIKTIGALSYAFSAWAIFFSGQLMFFSFYCLMPLYFLGIEHYLKKKSYYIFIISILLLVFTNWYFFYTISFFSPIYFTYRYYLLHNDFKGFIKSAATLVIAYTLSVGITMFYLLPTLSYLSGNNRIGGLTGLLFFDEIQTYMHQLASLFAPNYLYIYGNNIFETKWHVTREICMWAGSLTVLSVFISFTHTDKKKRNANIILYSTLLLLLIFPNGNAMMHGFSESSFRWTLLIIFINIMTMCTVLSELEQYSKNNIKKVTWVLCSFCLLIIPITAYLTNRNFFDYLPQFFLYASSALLLVIYGYTLANKKAVLRTCLVIVMIELGVFSTTLYTMKLDKTPIGTYEFNNQVMHVLQDNDNELVAYLNELEPSNYYEYYRVYIPNETICWNYSNNCPMEYGINGLMTYSSTISPVLNKLIQIAPSITAKQHSSLILNIEEGSLLNFLNTKYAFVFNQSELPQNMNWELIRSDYRGNIEIYKNVDYRPLATSYAQVKKYDQLITLDELQTTVFTESTSDQNEIQALLKDTPSTLNELTYEANQVISSVSSEQGGFMVLTLPYDKGWKVLVNGEVMKTYTVNGGFIGFGIPSGDSTLQLYFMPNGLKQGAIISIISLVSLLCITLIKTIKKRKK